MNIQPLATGTVLVTLGAMAGLFFSDLPTLEGTPALEPGVEVTQPLGSLPSALQAITSEPLRASAQLEAHVLDTLPASSPETMEVNEPSEPAPISSWQRLRPVINKRFAALEDAERQANIAFVHFLVRNGIEQDSLTDETLAGAFDQLTELHAQRDRELYAIQYEDQGDGTSELAQSVEVDDLSLEVMIRYEDLERALGGDFGGNDQSSEGTSAFASAAIDR